MSGKSEKVERNITLDWVKLILSILVITIHIQPLFLVETLGGWLVSNGIARIAVPFFFIVSGYYIANKIDDKKKIIKYLKHIIIVYIVWSLIYLPCYYTEFDFRSIIGFLVMGYYHLWFVPALILGIVILFFTKKTIKNIHLILAIAIVVFIIGYILEPYRFNMKMVRNGLFLGFPFVTIGYYICKRELASKIKLAYLIPIILLSAFTLLLESFFEYKIFFYRDLFLSLIICSPALFMLTLKLPQHKTSKFSNLIGQLPSSIYYVHILAVLIIGTLATYNIYNLPAILGLSILLSIIIIWLNKRIKIFL